MKKILTNVMIADLHGSQTAVAITVLADESSGFAEIYRHFTVSDVY